ncbi:MAG: hypothetical protein MJA84_10360 [Firmicutes bacterium]|nr:hypothetical protein [Bacillota bacterium]
MQINYITQKSTRQKGFWQPTVISNVDGSVTLQLTTFYFRDLEIAILKETWVPTEGDKIYVENNSVDPLYRIPADVSTNYQPLSGEIESSPGPVMWVENGILYVLTHEEGE